MTTLPNMGLVLPTRGSSGSGHWADTLDQNLSRLDNHDHSADSGARVPTAGISINADLSFNSAWAATALNRVTFSSVAPVAANKSLFVSSTDDELYWRSAAGANVKVTDASSLNVAAFTGGFGGDYTAVSAEAAYDDANLRYTFKQGGGLLWARMASGEVRILETSSSESVYVGLAAPAALAGSFTLTLPLVLPGTTTPLQLTSAGVITTSDTFANAVTFSSTATATGLITATAGATAAANQHFTVSGTGLFKHGTKTLSIASSAFNASSVTVTNAPAGCVTFSTASSADVYASITLPVGARILAIRCFIKDDSSSPTKVQATFISLTSAGTATSIASSAVSAGTSTNQTLTISPAATTIASSTGYSVRLRITTGTDLITVYSAEVDYDQP